MCGLTGRAILHELAANRTDPAVLAELAKGRLKGKKPELLLSLEGSFSLHDAQAPVACMRNSNSGARKSRSNWSRWNAFGQGADAFCSMKWHTFTISYNPNLEGSP